MPCNILTALKLSVLPLVHIIIAIVSYGFSILNGTKLSSSLCFDFNSMYCDDSNTNVFVSNLFFSINCLKNLSFVWSQNKTLGFVHTKKASLYSENN